MATHDAVGGLKSGTERYAEKAKSGIDDARSTIKDGANKFSDMTDDAMHGAQQTYQDAKKVAQRNIGDIERQIRDKPVQATLVAAGIGYLIGVLVNR